MRRSPLPAPGGDLARALPHLLPGVLHTPAATATGPPAATRHRSTAVAAHPDWRDAVVARVADPRTFDAYYQWLADASTTAGPVILPTGYSR